MSVVEAPVFWPKHQLAQLAKLLLLLLIGLLLFAAVGQVALYKIECEDVVLTADDGVTILTDEDNGAVLTAGRKCHASAGAFRVPLPEWLSGRLWWIAP